VGTKTIPSTKLNQGPSPSGDTKDSGLAVSTLSQSESFLQTGLSAVEKTNQSINRSSRLMFQPTIHAYVTRQ